jgi:hypothetical protein
MIKDSKGVWDQVHTSARVGGRGYGKSREEIKTIVY